MSEKFAYIYDIPFKESIDLGPSKLLPNILPFAHLIH